MDTGHACSKMLLRPSASSDECHEKHDLFDDAPRKTLVYLLASTCRLLGPLGAMMGHSSERKKVLGSPARRVAPSLRKCLTPVTKWDVFVSTSSLCSVDLRGLLLLPARLVSVKPLCLRVWP